MRQLGYGLGVAVLGVVAGTGAGAGFAIGASGLNHALLVAGATGLVGAGLGALLLRSIRTIG